jgi:peptidoglycan/xylan/chitin deacetylase (PgdA/CDA1 family)
VKNAFLPLLLALAALPVRADDKPAPPRDRPAPARAASGVPAAERPVEIHDRLAPGPAPGAAPRAALTLDACMGRIDGPLIDFLIRNKVPATIFATRRWLRQNPRGVALIKAHLDLFDVENHGANHIPAVIGKGKTVYGLAGEPDAAHLRREVADGAQAIKDYVGVTPRWYRAATGEYDAQSVAEINKAGYRIAGFSVNADEGATLPKAVIEKRLKRVADGDVIIAHMNKPQSDTAQGLSAGIRYLLAKGFVFVRVDRADLQPVPAAPRHPHHPPKPRLPA